MVSPLYKSTSIIWNLDASCKPPFDLSLMITRCQSFQVLWAKSKSKWQQAYKERGGETSYVTEVAAQWVLGVRQPWMRQKFSWNLCRKQMRQRSWDKVRLVENNQEGSQMWTIWKNKWTMDFNFRYMRSQLKIEKALLNLMKTLLLWYTDREWKEARNLYLQPSRPQKMEV